MADVGGVAGDRLRSFVERVERLHEERAALAADVREIYAEAKGSGFDVKIIKKVIKARAMDQSDRAEQDELFDLYMRALDSGTEVATRAGTNVVGIKAAE